MDKVTQVKTKYREQMWVKRIRECQESGNTVRAWCGENNVNEKSYYYWLRKIREKLCEVSSIHQSIIEVRPPLAAAECIEVTSGGINISIPAGTSAGTIEAVIRALKC